MTTYLMTSTAFEGEVIFKFDEAERLLMYDVTGATLSATQLDWLTNRLPRTLKELKAVLKASKGAKLTEQKQTGATFEQFWEAYDEKKRSSRKKTEARWRKMSQAQRDKALNFIPEYFRLLQGTYPKYAETYLNHELWNN